MAHDKTTWLLTIKSNDGHPLFALLVESELMAVPTPPAASPAAPAEQRPKLPVSSGDGEPKMTEPQRRYLFRLLATQGVEGKAAEEHLKDFFKVRSLKDVPKEAASQLIDHMVKDRKETEDGGA